MTITKLGPKLKKDYVQNENNRFINCIFLKSVYFLKRLETSQKQNKILSLCI